VRHMTSDRSDVVAVRLTSQIDDLSRSLSRAGVALGQRVRLLELAAVAAMQAVTLETSKTPEPATAPASVTPLSAAPSLRAAVAA
jgi:hypothetical protein